MKIVIIGCTHAGIAAMNQCLKYYPDATITVYERNQSISYLSCATYLHIAGSVKNLDEAMYANPEQFIKKGVQMRMQHDVIEIDSTAHTILAQDLQTKEFVHDTYDKLIMTTGSKTTIPVIPGIESTKVMLCKTCDQAQKLAKASKNAKKIAILGGGYSGVELAEGYLKSGHQVILFQRRDQLLNQYLDTELAQKVKQLLLDNNVKVMTKTVVTRFTETEDGKVLIKTSAGDYLVDMVTITPGVLPQADLLKGQVKLAKNGAIITNEYMQSSDPDIFAAGDVTEVHFNPTLDSKYIPLASHAIRQGALAGANVVTPRIKSMGTQATSGMLVFGHTVASTGLTLHDALQENFDAQAVFFEGNYRPDFMPTNTKISIELIYDRKTRQVLGAQLMSKHEVSQSANTISVIIQNKNTIDDLAYLDMLFSPNFDEPFNYLNLVAQKAVDQEYQHSQSQK